MRLEPDGTLTQLGWADPGDHRVFAIWMRDRTLYMDGSSWPGQSICTAYAWRWTGSALVETDASAEYPPIGEIDLSRLANQLNCLGPLAVDPAVLRLTFGPELKTTVAERHFDLNESLTHPKFVELGRIGHPYLVLTVKCSPVGGSAWETHQVLFDRIDGSWRAISLYP